MVVSVNKILLALQLSGKRLRDDKNKYLLFLNWDKWEKLIITVSFVLLSLYP